MNFERWEQIDNHFDHALSLPPEKRADYLDEVCKDDLELRRKIESLLSNAEEGEDASFFDLSSLPEKPLALDEQIGPYRLLSILGKGGMGVVYLTERVNGTFKRKEALKVLQRGITTEDSIKRFRQERQILAQLDHPNIAQLYDGNISKDGRPYLVMEYIDGMDISTYCNEHSLSVEDRLKLFKTCCSAVKYAHQQMVVHRDLKPSNILISSKGKVTLVDFGIAKLLDPDTEHVPTFHTRQGRQLLTPEYASPEQIDGKSPTAKMDVYSLGIILYELLTGHRPYQFESKSWSEVVYTILNYEPKRPSSIVTKPYTFKNHEGLEEIVAPKEISRSRSTTQKRLSRQLKGDLDVIVMKALHKDPDERYNSAAELLEDIDLYLTHKPIKARPDRLTYKAKKFARRNRGKLVSVIAVIAILIGTGLFYVQNIRIERDNTKAALTQSEAVSEFLVDVFELSDGYSGNADSLTAREILNQGIEKVRTELNDEPSIQVELMDKLGRILNNLSLYEESLELLTESLQIRDNRLSNDQLGKTSTQFELAFTHWRNSNYNTADSLYREALETRVSLLGENHLLVAEVKKGIGSVLQSKGRYNEAIVFSEQALLIYNQFYTDQQLEIAGVINNLGASHSFLGQYGASMSYYKEALDILLLLPGNYNVDIGTVQNNYSASLARMGELDLSEDAQREALRLWSKELGDDHASIPIGIGNLGKIKVFKEEYDEAEVLFREALDLATEIVGEDHSITVVSLIFLGDFLRIKGELDSSAVLQENAISKLKKISGDRNPFVARNMHNLGLTYIEQGKEKLAESQMYDALNILRTELPSSHPDIATSLNDLGEFLINTNRASEGDSMLYEALDIRRRAYFNGHWQVGETLNALGKNHYARQDYIKADSLFTESYSILQVAPGSPPSLILEVLENLVSVNDALENTEKAQEFRSKLEERV